MSTEAVEDASLGRAIEKGKLNESEHSSWLSPSTITLGICESTSDCSEFSDSTPNTNPGTVVFSGFWLSFPGRLGVLLFFNDSDFLGVLGEPVASRVILCTSELFFRHVDTVTDSSAA